MPRKRYRCERVRKNNGVIEAFFKSEEGDQEEYILINVIAEPDRYVVGKVYWWSDEPAFPH